MKKQEPRLTPRIGKKPIYVMLCVLCIMIAIILYNIFTREAASVTRKDAGRVMLQPATDMGHEVYKNESDAPTFLIQQKMPAQSPQEVISKQETHDAAHKSAMEADISVDVFSKMKLVEAKEQPTASNEPYFLEKAVKHHQAQYLDSTRIGPLSRFELKAGSVIPSVLISAINSDLPGDLIAQVMQNVYDSATGRFLLIPQGAKLYGSYDSQIAYGQKRLLVVWRRLIFPDSSSLELQNMTGASENGQSGFEDQLNNHYGTIVGWGLGTSLFSSLFQISQRQNNATQNMLTPSQIAAQTTAQNMTQLGIDVTRKNLNIQPTLEIRPGYRFVVMVNKDVVFPGIYSDVSE